MGLTDHQAGSFPSSTPLHRFLPLRDRPPLICFSYTVHSGFLVRTSNCLVSNFSSSGSEPTTLAFLPVLKPFVLALPFFYLRLFHNTHLLTLTGHPRALQGEPPHNPLARRLARFSLSLPLDPSRLHHPASGRCRHPQQRARLP
jgi:hypothetical protein